MLQDNRPDILPTRIALAKRNIFALYGGRKGHGFWLYTTPHALALTKNFEPGFDLSGQCIPAPEGGKQSGNPCFWMFEEVLPLLSTCPLTE